MDRFGVEAGGGKLLRDGVSRRGAKDSSVFKRVKGAKGALSALLQTKVFIKSMHAKKTFEMRTCFIESRWRYGLVFAPMAKEIVDAFDAVDARFIAATIFPVRAE